jgi:pSer/pThr/pTyr-binding forkhead associated (FHA) protein
MKNYYQTLGVQETASIDEIRSAYRRLLQASLEDKESFNMVKEAFEALRTPEKRAEYDQELLTSKSNNFASSRTGTAMLSQAAAKNIQEHTCASCGQVNPKNEPYCKKCGALLNSGEKKQTSSPRRPRLVDEKANVYPVKPGVNSVGRESADIIIQDKTVSRQHAHIVYDEDRDIYSIEDLNSTNGTLLNGMRLSAYSPSPVLPGDDLQFGNFQVRVISGATPLSLAEVELAKKLEDEKVAHETSVHESGTYKLDAIDPPETPLAELRLLQGSGPDTVKIIKGQNTIGRMNDNVICIRSDRYVSGHHAVLDADDRVSRLIDLGSTNGTFLNGLRLTPNIAVAINDGDEISVGGAVFVFRRGDSRPISHLP